MSQFENHGAGTGTGATGGETEPPAAAHARSTDRKAQAERPLALVTGASSGIGSALARAIAADGYDLVLVARRLDRLEELANEIGPGRAEIVVADLATPGAGERIEAAVAALGRPLERLVNNAGVGRMEDFVETPPDDIMGMVDLNMRALVDLTRRFLPDMVRRGRGGVLNVASTAAFQPGAGMATYFATKSFVLSLSEGLHAEVARHGVTVTALCPGPTRTEFGAVSGTDHSHFFTSPLCMRAEAVAVAGWRGHLAGRRVIVPGIVNKFGAAVAPLSPKPLVLAITRRITRRDRRASG